MNPRSPLCDIDGAQLLTGKSIGALQAMTGGRDLVEGQLLWVWNVATNPNGKIRDLRYWVPEILALGNSKALATIHALDLEQVIFQLLAESRREFPAGETQQLLQVRHNTLLDLKAELQGAQRAQSNFYPRAGLVKFFRARWLGQRSNLDAAKRERISTDDATTLHASQPVGPQPATRGAMLTVNRPGRSQRAATPSEISAGGKP